jgi:hypothetical protein
MGIISYDFQESLTAHGSHLFIKRFTPEGFVFPAVQYFLVVNSRSVIKLPGIGYKGFLMPFYADNGAVREFHYIRYTIYIGRRYRYLSPGLFRFGVAVPFYAMIYKIGCYLMDKPGELQACITAPASISHCSGLPIFVTLKEFTVIYIKNGNAGEGGPNPPEVAR